MRAVWIVEMLGALDWHATVGVALSRDEARERLVEWRRGNPTDDFRLTRYVPKAKERAA
jgi:hypothetical protein